METTKIVLVATVIILVLYDVFAMVKWGPKGTLSVVTYYQAKKYPAIPFFAGVLIGHLFAKIVLK